MVVSWFLIGGDLYTAYTSICGDNVCGRLFEVKKPATREPGPGVGGGGDRDRGLSFDGDVGCRMLAETSPPGIASPYIDSVKIRLPAKARPVK